jgi:glycyl-tRNA synthetase beta chain
MAQDEYFFELLLEEIPAWMLAQRLERLREGLGSILRGFTGEDPPPSSIRVGATSRRIWFVLANLPARQPDREEEIKGPSIKVSWASEGVPSRALEGFLRKNQAAAADLVQRDDYVWLRRSVAGKPIGQVLGEEIPRLVEGLHWPKTMRWGSGSRSYIRPVHSVVSIYDGQPLPLTILGMASGTATNGHRVLGRGAVEVSSFDDYRQKLRERHVEIDAEARVATLRATASALAAEVGGTPADDEEIWEQWKYLTEAPGIVRAEFDPQFLSLPFEVLVTVMRVHQKQLPIWREARLTSSYLAVMDQIGDPDGNVAGGNAFVTNARFADAKFFHQADRRSPLASRVPELARLQFQEKLGNYLEKTERIVGLARSIRSEITDGEDAAVEEAARLAKADLVTEMVKEFTELQGRIGGIYAREEGRPEEVWQAVYDHYLPVNVEDELPRTLTGAIVALADKIDTLAGFFRIGLKPSGSKDPFALRRAAQGAVQILLNREGWAVPIPLERLLGLALHAHGLDTESGRSAAAELHDFIGDRVRTLMEHPRYGGFAYDEISATMAAGWGGALPDLIDRLEAVRRARRSPEFLSILDSAKRIRNIAGEEAETDVDDSILEHATEKRLADLSRLVTEQIDELVASGNYGAALETFAGMAPELERFFEDVLVNTENAAVRRNRIALLNRVGLAARGIADITRIVVDRSEYNAR